jgi:hypothetical protein
MRDLFYGALEHSVRTIMVRDQAALPSDAEIRRLSENIMEMVRPAYGLLPSPSPAVPARGLNEIVRRLESAVSRLEKVSS